MAHEGAIVQRYEGKAIDEEFLKLASETYGDYIAFVTVNEDNTMITDRVSLQDVKDTMSEYMGPFSLMFGKDCPDDDRPPYIILTKDDKSILVALLLEGNFAGSGFEAPGGESHPDEWYVVQQYLLPKLTELAENTDENVAKMVAYLEKPFNKNEILKSVCPLPGARCELLFIFADGQRVSLRKGDLHHTYEWGEVSNPLGYNPTQLAAPQQTGKTSLMDRLKAKASSSAAPISPSPSVPSVKATPTAEEGNKLLRDPEDRPYVKPPGRRCDSTKNLGNFYDWAGGYRPDGWESGVKHSDRAVPVRVKKELWVDEKKWDEYVAKQSFILVKGDKAPAAIAPSGGTPVEKSLLTASERDKLIKVFKPKLVKSIDDKSSFVGDPAKLAEDLRNKELLSEALPGLFVEGIATVFSWGDDAFDHLIKENPTAARMLMRELVFRLWMTHGKMEKEGKKSAVM